MRDVYPLRLQLARDACARPRSANFPSQRMRQRIAFDARGGAGNSIAPRPRGTMRTAACCATRKPPYAVIASAFATAADRFRRSSRARENSGCRRRRRAARRKIHLRARTSPQPARLGRIASKRAGVEFFASAVSLPGLRAASAMRMPPSRANVRATDALRPSPAPTINAVCNWISSRLRIKNGGAGRRGDYQYNDSLHHDTPAMTIPLQKMRVGDIDIEYQVSDNTDRGRTASRRRSCFTRLLPQYGFLARLVPTRAPLPRLALQFARLRRHHRAAGRRALRCAHTLVADALGLMDKLGSGARTGSANRRAASWASSQRSRIPSACIARARQHAVQAGRAR